MAFLTIPGHPDYLINEYGNVFSTKSNQYLSPGFNNSGYLHVDLCQNQIRTHLSVHRLVYQVHVGPIEDGYQIHHVDEDKTNNHVSNLQCVTSWYNANYSNSYSAQHGQPIPIYSPNNTLYYIYNARAFAREHGLNCGSLGQLIHGRQNQHKGWTLHPK